MGFRALLAAGAALMVAQSAMAADVPLIERAKLFGNPSKTGGRACARGHLGKLHSARRARALRMVCPESILENVVV